MAKEQKIVTKVLLYTILTMLVGCALLTLPIISFMIRCLAMLAVFLYLYDMYDYVINSQEGNKKSKKKKK